MPATPQPPPDPGTLWRVASFGLHQRTPAGHRYWWENGSRDPAGTVVVQVTHAGEIAYHPDRRSPAGDPVRPGSILLFTYGEDTAYGLREPLPAPYICSWVTLSGAGLRQHADTLCERYGCRREVGVDHPLFRELEELIELAEPARAAPPTTIAAAVHTLVMHLFEQAEESWRLGLPPVQQAIDAILRQPHLVSSLDAVAQRFGCAREHLSRSFRDRVGQPAMGFVADAKRRRALRLLRDSGLPLADVARQAGFATPRTMTRQLRAATGQNPSRLRTAR